MRAHQSLQQLAVRVGAGDHAAFRNLYAECAPSTLAAIRGVLPDPTHSMHVVRATFCEVWWMCAFDVRCGAPPQDMWKWIADIARRRGDERGKAISLILGSTPVGEAAFWTGLLHDHDRWTRFELATMLDGHDTIEPIGSGLATRHAAEVSS